MCNLLRVEPQKKLTFRFELRRRASCTIRLSNISGEDVAFKIMTTDPDKYFGEVSTGILLPGSSCDVKVTMRAREIPSNMRCRDEVFIKSAVASPWDTAESCRNLFKERGRVVEVHRLKVVYVQQSLNSQRRDRNGRPVDNIFVKGISFFLLCLIFGYLILEMLQFIRTLIVVIVIFVITMIKKQVSDYVEEWIHKILVYLCIQFLPVALETLLYRCIDWVLVVCETIYDLCIDFLSKVFKQR